MKKDKIGLFVTAYGTPYTESDSESYYSHIRHGRKSSPEALQDFTRELYEEKRNRTFVAASVDFVSSHLEVLYDNDYECKVVCDELGTSYYCPEMPNTNLLFIGTHEKVVLKELDV